MSTLSCSLALAFAVASGLGCTGATTEDGTRAVSATALTSGSAPASLDDGRIAGILGAAFTAAADESRPVAIAAIDPQLRHYARSVIFANEKAFQYEEALRDAAGLPLTGSYRSRQIAYESKVAGDELSARRGLDLQRAYLSREVRFQTEFLRLIDDDLLPAARSEAMRDELLELRVIVERLRSQGSVLARWLMTEP
jgi:hypothetical protein